MNLHLIRSDRFVNRSDGSSGTFHSRPTQTPPPTGARLACSRAPLARNVGRDFQALRSAELPLRHRPWARPEVLPKHQPARRSPETRLCTKFRASEDSQIDRRFAQTAEHARRDLRNKCRTAAAARGARIDLYGFGTRCIRYRQSGCHPGRHGHLLSRRRRLTTQFNGGAR